MINRKGGGDVSIKNTRWAEFNKGRVFFCALANILKTYGRFHHDDPQNPANITFCSLHSIAIKPLCIAHAAAAAAAATNIYGLLYLILRMYS